MIDFENVSLEFNVSTYGQLEKITDTLSKCRVRIFYKGLNRNRTYISDEFAQQLIDSLPYAPVKGIFDNDELDFEDHGSSNTEGKIYGIVPENPHFAWEKHLDCDGVEREYATADVFLFTGLYPEANLVPDKPQSMEIYKKTFQGEWRISEDDGNPYFYFTKGSLVGLQTLGTEVEPCFEGAAFFSLYKDFQDCLKYIKTITKKEGEKMDKTMFRLSDSEKADILFDALNPNFSEEGQWKVDYAIIDVYDDYAVCRDFTNKCYVRVSYTKDDTANTVTIGDTVQVYITDVTATEMSALEAMKAIGTYEEVKTGYEALQNEVETLKNEKTNLETEKADFEAKVSALEEEKVQIENSVKEKEEEVATCNTQIETLTNEKVQLENDKAALETERDELAGFKKNVETEQKMSIIDEFSEYLNDEQINELKGNMEIYTVADFKKEVCTKAYDANKAIFSKAEDNSMIFKGDHSGLNKETGALKLLSKYKNGGNK